MIPGRIPCGAVAGGVLKASGQLAHMVSLPTNPVTSYEWTVNFGPPHPSRRLVTLTHQSNGPVVDSFGLMVCRLGGVNSTLLNKTPATTHTNNSQTWISERQDSGGPQGSSGILRVERSGSGRVLMECYAATFAVYGLLSPTIHDIAAWVTNTGTVDVPADGILMAMADRMNGSIAGFSWVGVTETGDQAGGVGNIGRMSTGLLVPTTLQSNRTVTATPSAGSGTLLAVSMR